MAALNERQQRISDGLNAADKAKQDLEVAHAQVADELKAAKAQAAGLIEQANRRAQQLAEEVKAQAAAEANRLLTAARAEIESERAAARDQLRLQVASLAVAGAEKILQAEIDVSKHAALLDRLSTQLH